MLIHRPPSQRCSARPSTSASAVPPGWLLTAQTSPTMVMSAPSGVITQPSLNKLAPKDRISQTLYRPEAVLPLGLWIQPAGVLSNHAIRLSPAVRARGRRRECAGAGPEDVQVARDRAKAPLRQRPCRARDGFWRAGARLFGEVS
jgi:hypothetical protein